MNTSIFTILPTTPPSPVTPSTPPPSDDSGFSDELSRAQSKPQTPADPPAKKPAAKKAKPKPTDTKAKIDAKAQTAPADDSTDEDAETQAAATTTQTGQKTAVASDQDAQAADPNAETAIHVAANPKMVALKLPQTSKDAQDSAEDEDDSNPAVGKTSDSSKTTKTPADPTAVATALPVAPSTNPAPTTKDAAETDANDSVTAEKSVSQVHVSPFAPVNSSTDDSSDDSQTADAQASEQLPDKGKAVVIATPEPQPAVQLLADAGAAAPSAVNHVSHTPTVLAPPAPTPDAQFVESNHPTIVSSVHGNLLPNGGTMTIRLDPPDLGAMHITVRMDDGVLSASFETSSDQATRLLSHTLSDLKTALESQGMSVDRLHVHQAAKSEGSSSQNSDSDSSDQQKQKTSDGRSQQDEQQRREVLRRMWRRASGNRDPLDLVA